MEKAPAPKRPRYDAAFRAEALRLASESRSALAAVRALNIDAKRSYAWQKAAHSPYPPTPQRLPKCGPCGVGRQGLAQELDILKKSHRHLLASPNPIVPLYFIDRKHVHCAVQQLCQVLDMVPSRYYAWRHTQAAGRMLRQRASGKSVVPPQNRGTRSPRLARLCRFSRCLG